MALVVADRVQETTTTSGTGTLSLGGAVSGFQSFVTGIGNGNTTYYAIYDQTAQVWEVGLGTVTSGSPNTLSRTTVLANSSGNTSPITLAGNSSSVFCAYPAGKAVIQDASGNLGVGVASPLQKLDVNGTMRSTSASATGGVQVFNNQSDNTTVNAPIGSLDFIASSGVQKQASIKGYVTGSYSDQVGLGFYTNNGTSYGLSALLDSRGNLGLGTTPTASWRSGANALQSGAFLSAWTQNNGTVNLSFAAYEGSADVFKYLTTGNAPTLYSQVNGVHTWYNAPAGTAGNTISFTNAMALDTNSALGVTGSGIFGGNLTVANNATTTDASIELGQSRTGNGNSYIDFHASAGTDYDFRVIRSPGLNGDAAITNAGTGSMTFNLNGSEAGRFTSAGNFGIGVVPAGSYKFEVGTTASGIGSIFRTSPSQIQITATDGNVTQAVGYAYTSQAYGGTISNHPYAFLVNNTERARFDTSGNFGLGTGSPSYKLDVSGSSRSTAYLETRNAISASAIDLTAGNYFSKTISGATTFTISNTPSSGTVASFILDLTNGGSSTVTWWTGVKWASGIPPTLTTSGRDVLGFFTYDGGTTWSGFVLGKAMA